MGFRTLDVNVSGKHADLIRDGKYEIYSADWLRSTIRMLMNEAYEYGMQNVFPYDKEMEKACGDGWKKLHEEINERIDTMLDIGIQHLKGTESKLTVVDEANWPEIKFSNHHYLPFSEELSEKIFNAKEVDNG